MISILKGKPKEQGILEERRRTQAEANARQLSQIQEMKGKMAELDKCVLASICTLSPNSRRVPLDSAAWLPICVGLAVRTMHMQTTLPLLQAQPGA